MTVRRSGYLLGCFFIAQTLVLVPVANASTYSQGTQRGVTQHGTEAEFHNNYMWMDSGTVNQSNFIAHVLWANSGNPCGQYWVEAGITYGYSAATLYIHYFARNSVRGYAQWSDGPPTTWDGSNHTYRLKYDSPGVYTIYRDGVQKLREDGFGFGTCVSEVGLENSIQPDWRTVSHTFDAIPLRWQNTSNQWILGWTAIRDGFVNQPCGAGWNPPNCYHGVWYSTTHWADNKP